MERKPSDGVSGKRSCPGIRLSALACELVGELGSGADPKLAVDARQVRLDGLGAHEQLTRDLWD